MLIMLLGLLWPLIYAISLMTISTMLVSNEPFLLQIVAYSAAFLIPLRGIYYIILSVANRNKLNRGTLIQTLLEMIFAALIVILPNFSFIAFIVVYEIYLTFYITIKFADTFIYGRNRIFKSMIPSLCQAVFFLHIFLAIIFMPDNIRDRAVEMGVAIHLSLFGIAHLCDFLAIVVKNDKAKSLFSSIRITMPGFIGLTIPH